MQTMKRETEERRGKGKQDKNYFSRRKKQRTKDKRKKEQKRKIKNCPGLPFCKEKRKGSELALDARNSFSFYFLFLIFIGFER